MNNIWRDSKELQECLDKYSTIQGKKTLKKYKEKFGEIEMRKWASVGQYYKIVFSSNYISIDEYINRDKNNKPKKGRFQKKQKSIKKYKEYMKSKERQDKRVKFFIKAKFTCEICKGKFDNKELNLHHHTYERAGRERNNDLAVVCLSCHKDIHYKNGKKIKLNEKELRKRYNELLMNLSK